MSFFDLMIPTGSCQYTLPATYIFEGMITSTAGATTVVSGSVPPIVGQLWPRGNRTTV